MKNLLGIILILNLCAQSYISQNSDSILTALNLANHDTTKCRILNNLIELEPLENQWIKYNQQMLSIARSNLIKLSSTDSTLRKKFLLSLSYGLNNLGYLADTRGNTSNALKYYNESLILMKQLNNKEGIAVCLNNIGYVYDNQGNVNMALEYYFKSLTIYEKIGNNKGIAQIYNNIASIYEYQNDISKALEFYGKSLKLKLKINDKLGVATTLNNIGNLQITLVDYDKAQASLQKSLHIHEVMNNKKGIAIVLNNLGRLNCYRQDYKAALNLCFMSLKMANETDDKETIISTLNDIGNTYFLTNDLYNSEKYILQSLKINSQPGFAEARKISALNLYHIYSKKNLPKDALKYYELYIKMRDSINNVETNRISLNKQLKHEYDKKSAADSIKVAEEKRIAVVKLKQEKLQRNYLYTGLCLVGFFSLFMVNRFRLTKKQKRIIEIQKQEVEIQKHLADEKQKEILDSIHYAKRIQQALLPNKTYIKRYLGQQ